MWERYGKRVVVILISVFLFSGCEVPDQTGTSGTGEFIAKIIQNETLQIAIEVSPQRIYGMGSADINVFYQNNHMRNVELLIKNELQDIEGHTILTDEFVLEIKKGSTGTRKLEMTLNEALKTGRYIIKTTILDAYSKDNKRKLVLQNRSKDDILYFANTDDFETLEDAFWKISDKELGQTILAPQNVSVQNGVLGILLSKDSLIGGEVYSAAKQGYGTYEIRMKVPNVPSSITGFFMYYPPDFQSEIDIEVFNDSSGKLLLTTYSDGEISNEKEVQLGFDPTQDFHDYRFEYRENQVVFYVDDSMVGLFDQGIPKNGMQLMVNCWYPKWLEQIPPSEDTQLLIEKVSY